MAAPYDWVEHVDPTLIKLDSIPLVGSIPPFDWNLLSHKIGQIFERGSFSILPQPFYWRNKQNLLDDLQQETRTVAISLFPLHEKMYWILPTSSIKVLTNWFMNDQESPSFEIDHSVFIETFYQFFVTELIEQAFEISSLKTINPIVEASHFTPHEESLCRDIIFQLAERPIRGRLFISSALREELVSFFHDSTIAPLIASPNQTAKVQLSLTAGEVFLHLDEWKAVQPGDCILLDTCSLNPNTFKGPVIITHKGREVFRGLLTENKLKIS